MMKLNKTVFTLLAVAVVVGCGKPDSNENKQGSGSDKEEEKTPEVVVKPFMTGADVSWTSEMEAAGKTFKGTDGKTADLFAILSDCGVDAVRLRVWVGPTGGWSGKDDVVKLAKRATEKGLAVMVDFHYSDFFADPSRQTVPEAWKADSGDISKMATHVKDHTTEVLQALKAAGVAPKWVQIGNETRNGMIWPSGQLWNDKGDIAGGWQNFVNLYNAGYNAAKAVFSNILVMPHLNNAFDDNAWWFSKFKAAGGKMDMIALSHYPQTVTGKTWQQANDLAVSRIQALSAANSCKVMISEVGIKASDLALGKQILTDFIGKIKSSGSCSGIFYWEPEVYGGWKPAIYTTLGWNSYDMGCFTAQGAPSDAFLTLKNN